MTRRPRSPGRQAGTRGAHPGVRQADIRRQRGFTLVELMVTLAVTVIGLAGLMSLHVATVRGNQSTSRIAEATAVGQKTLEELRGMTIAEIETAFTRSIPFTGEVMSTVDGRAAMVYRRTLDIDDLSAVSANLIRMRIVVAWTDDGAAPGSDNGVHDHAVALELIRTRLEEL